PRSPARSRTCSGTCHVAQPGDGGADGARSILTLRSFWMRRCASAAACPAVLGNARNGPARRRHDPVPAVRDVGGGAGFAPGRLEEPQAAVGGISAWPLVDDAWAHRRPRRCVWVARTRAA